MTGDVADTDEFAISDGGTMKKVDFSVVRDAVFADVSGDATVAAGGVLTIAANAVHGSMLNTDAISAQTEMTGDVADADELLISDGGVLKRADFSVVRDAVFADVSGDATVAAGGVLTIAADAVHATMINSDVAGSGLEQHTDGSLRIAAAAAGDGLSGGAGSALALDLNELTAAAVNVAADSIAIIDADDSNGSKKESIADLVSAMAGNGLQASSGVVSITHAQEVFASTDLSSNVATLSGTPASDEAVYVFMNGLLLSEGSSRDYTISGQDITLASANAMQAEDELVVKYINQ